MELNELQRRELIVRTRAENPELTDNAIAKKLKYHPKTVARVLKRFSETLSIKKSVDQVERKVQQTQN
jgi:DNA-binding MarR family transcriptional regulator